VCGVCLSPFAFRFSPCFGGVGGKLCDYGGLRWEERDNRATNDFDIGVGVGIDEARQRGWRVGGWATMFEYYFVVLVFGFWGFFHTHLWGMLGLLRFVTLSDIVLSVMVSVQT
jgi:hypothetical protein